MPAQTILKLYLRGWQDAVSMLGRPAHLVPFLVIALLKLVPLICVTYFSLPFMARFSVPLVRAVFGEEALHYPQHVFRLVDMYRAIDLAVVLLFAFMMYGWAVFMMADTLQGKHARLADYRLQIAWSIPSFLLIGALCTLVTFGIPFLLDRVTDSLRGPRVIQLLTLTAVALWALVMPFLIHSLFFLMSAPPRLLGAIARGARFASRRFEVTVFTLLTALGLHAAGAYLVSRLLTPHAGASDPLFLTICLKLVFDTAAPYYLFAATTSLAVAAKKER